jgi:hypothetical protein
MNKRNQKTRGNNWPIILGIAVKLNLEQEQYSEPKISFFVSNFLHELG